MTETEAPLAPDHPTRRDTLWVTDAELVRRSGVPEKVMREALRMLDANPRSGFPRKDPLYGGRRYMPAVQSYWAAQHNPQAQNNARLKPGNHSYKANEKASDRPRLAGGNDPGRTQAIRGV